MEYWNDGLIEADLTLANRLKYIYFWVYYFIVSEFQSFGKKITDFTDGIDFYL